MTRPSPAERTNRTTRILVMASMLTTSAPAIRAQEPAVPTADVLQRFESRLEALESENRALRDQVRELMESGVPAPGAEAAGGNGNGSGSQPASGATAPADEDPSTAGDPESADDLGGPIASVGPTAPAAASRGSHKRVKLNAWLGQGFELASEDDEYQLQFHNETQFDLRYFDHTGQGTVHNGFFIPRQIWSFSGRMTKRIEFLASFQRGLSSFEMRDVLMNFKVLDEDRLMIKVGRFRTPYTYEFYAISNPDLISPERSVYNLNFSNLREYGIMTWGELADDRVDYAAGIFNGVRNGFENLNDDPSFAGYLNVRPFRHWEERPYLKYLNFGASTDVSHRSNTTGAPPPMRTAVNASLASGASTASPAFLTFNDGVRENGMKPLGSAHAAWFYNRLSLLAEYDFGGVNYIASPLAPPSARVNVPVWSYNVQAGFFLTGEHVTRRGPVDVKKPLNLKRGPDFGLGALEATARYADLRMGGQVFSGGLVDPNLWTNHVQVIDVGFNWYLNRYLKVYLDWQHAQFGAPVTFGSGRFLDSSNLYWARLQLLF